MVSTARRHLDAINLGLVTKTNVIGMRKILNADARMHHGWTVSRATEKTVNEFTDLDVMERLAEAPPKVDAELYAGGLAQLRNPRFAKRLAQYKPEIDAITEFRLVGFDWIGCKGQYATPVYMADGPAGHFFFRNVPWQAGGNGPEIIDWAE